MKAIGYVRVSTEGQASEGVSLDAQEARIRAWCQANGYALESVHIDAGLSGSKSNRPGLQAALDVACKDRAALVVISRLARSTKDTLNIADRLDRAGADLVSLSEKIDTTSASGKMVFRMLAVLAEFERDQISERTSSAMRHMKTQGRRVGTIPYGFDLSPGGRGLIPNQREQGALSIMRALRAEGLSLRRIASELEARGVSAKNGGAWKAETIRGILAREAA